MGAVSKNVDEVLRKIRNGDLTVQDGFSLIRNDSKVCCCKSVLKEADLELYKKNEDCKTILVFSDKRNNCPGLGTIFGKKTVITVTAGKAYHQYGKLDFEINPKNLDDYRNVFVSLKKVNLEPDCIINLAFVSCETKNMLDLGVYAFYFIIQCISEYKMSSVRQLYAVYRENSGAEASCVGGFCKSVGKALPGVSFSTIAVDPKMEQNDIFGVLQKELDYGFLQADREIVFENNRRFERKLEGYEPDYKGKTVFREYGVYLITGGLGKIGTLFLKHLSSVYHAKFIICQRKPFSSKIAEKIENIGLSLSDVMYEYCNIEDMDSMEHVKKSAHEKFGFIHGIIHCAGIVTEVPITKEEKETFSRVITTKANSIKVLDKVFQDEKLDFFFACSSISSVIGDFGQCSYAVANRYLEAYMYGREKLREQGIRQGCSFTISWPLWKSGGMHIYKDGESLYLKSSGMEYLENVQGLFLWEQLLKDSITNKIVFYGNKEKILTMISAEHKLVEKKKVSASMGFSREKLIYHLKEIAAEVLDSKTDKIDEKETIGIYGFDSISLREYAEKINEQLSVDISPTLFYACSTIESICNYLLKEYRELSFHEEDKQEKIAPVDMVSENRQEDIAIIGMDGILPMSYNLEEFFSNLLSGKDLTGEIPKERWDFNDFYTMDKTFENKVNAKWGAFIPDIEKFDPRFFGISPREAEYMDPQQRLFLRTTWNAIEDAGYRASDLSGKNIGVFVGMQFSDYQELLRLSCDMDPQMETGNAHTMLSNRVSYFFNWKGPSENIDTACSSSLVAVHRAIRSIRSGESSMAVVGGVSLVVSPLSYVATGKLGILSKTGSGKTFDQNADGYVKGEGVVSIILKRLSDAVKDRDSIYAVIKGSAVNHGGHANTLTSPNSNAQADLIVKAWNDAGITPNTISYIETHGTGTKLGDPVEVDGLKMAFAHSGETLEEGYCGIGSVKPSIGHLEPASGIAGLTKVVLAMKYNKIPGTIHVTHVNEYLKLEHSPFHLVAGTEEWKQVAKDGEKLVPKRAGISSFGFGGTNAHVVLEEYQSEKPVYEQRKRNVAVFSARTKESLFKYAEKMLQWLEKKACNKSGNKNAEKLFCEEIVKLIAAVLFVDTEMLDPSDDIQEYDIDEITWKQLKKDVEQKFNIELSDFELYQNHSIRELSSLIWKQNKEILMRFYKIEDDLEDKEDISWDSFFYTLQLGREPMKERAAFVAGSFQELYKKITSFVNKIGKENWYEGTAEESSSYTGDMSDCKKLAQSWCLGKEPDWSQLYSHIPIRISLPTYAFVEQSYWIKKKVDWRSFFAWRSGHKSVNIVQPDRNNELFYERTFEKTGKFLKEGHKLVGCYLLFVQGELEETFYKSLTVYEQTEWILIGGRQTVKGLEYMEADLNNYTQCEEQIMDLIKRKGEISGVIDLTAAGTDTNNRVSIPYGKFAILQKLIDNRKNVLEVLQITCGLEASNPELADLSGSEIQGMIEVLGYEYAKVRTLSVDIDYKLQDASELAAFMSLQDRGIHEVCIREGMIWKPVLKKIDFYERRQEIAFQSDKVYVVAGGTSGIGLQIMQFMMQKGAKKFAVFCHNELPNQDQWKNRIENSSNEKEVNKLIMLSKLYQAGAEIHISTVNLSDEKKVFSWLEEIRNVSGEIGGCIQAASYDFQESPLFIDKTEDDIRKVLEPKVNGTQVLSKCMEKDKLDFFIVFSSVASLLPNRSVGMSHYVAANRFLDHFTAYKNVTGHPEYKCVNWVLWGETGNACKEETVKAMKKYGMLPMTNKEGIQCFEAFLGMSRYQVIAGRLEQRLAGVQKDFKEQEEEQRKIKKGRKEEIKGNTLEELKQVLKEIIASVLKLDIKEIQDQEEFGLYGVDSIIMEVLVQEMESKLETSLNPSIIIENNTLDKLAYEIFYHSEYYIVKNNVQEFPVHNKEEIPNVFIPSETAEEKVAVIGMSCDFPGAKGKEAYWDVLSQGKDCVTEIPESRWEYLKYYSPNGGEGKTNSKWGGFIQDAEVFDAAYFKIKEKDAQEMDPLQKKFLESAAETIADSGYSERELWGRQIGVFGAARVSNYAYKLKDYDKNTIVGTAQNFVAAQIAQYFNFTGPNMIIDTACSSSLVAIHQACQSILHGECEMAVAGGAELLLDEIPYLILGAMKGLSPSGKCYAFDKKADGFVPGEGAGTVLLKKLSDAIHDGDHIYGVIDGSFLNNDGNTMGITTPNPNIQKELLLQTYKRAQINPETISYMEAHGTGTMIGDPIELKSLTSVFREYTDKKSFCAIGSVKANIGHLLLASGAAGVIKILLALQKKQIPKSIHCEEPNPRFNFKESPFYINCQLTDWKPSGGTIRRAGVSSFGLGGTNAHIVLRELSMEEQKNYHPIRVPRKIEFHGKSYPWSQNMHSEVKMSVSVEEKKPMLRLEKL